MEKVKSSTSAVTMNAIINSGFASICSVLGRDIEAEFWNSHSLCLSMAAEFRWGSSPLTFNLDAADFIPQPNESLRAPLINSEKKVAPLEPRFGCLLSDGIDYALGIIDYTDLILPVNGAQRDLFRYGLRYCSQVHPEELALSYLKQGRCSSHGAAGCRLALLLLTLW